MSPLDRLEVHCLILTYIVIAFLIHSGVTIPFNGYKEVLHLA